MSTPTAENVTTENVIVLTDAAAKEVNAIVDQQVETGDLVRSETFLRVGVKGGGCSGFQYLLDLVQEEPTDNDEVFETHGLRVMIDNKSALYLEGTVIDFKEEVMQSGFVFNNPNATSTCGCGSSFQA